MLLWPLAACCPQIEVYREECGQEFRSCSRLEELTDLEKLENNKGMAEILVQCPLLTQLWMRRHHLGDMTILAMVRHFESLTVLDLKST
jgi:hypothetical protein